VRWNGGAELVSECVKEEVGLFGLFFVERLLLLVVEFTGEDFFRVKSQEKGFGLCLSG